MSIKKLIIITIISIPFYSYNSESDIGGTTSETDIDRLFELIQQYDAKGVQELLDRNRIKDINTRRGSDNSTALIEATTQFSNNKEDTESTLKIIKLLLENKADPNLQNDYGATALINAVYLRDKPLIELLLQYGAKVDLQNNDGNTALLAAAHGNNKDVIKLLINHGANINIKNSKDQNARDYASKEGYKDIVSMLEFAEKIYKPYIQGIKGTISDTILTMPTDVAGIIADYSNIKFSDVWDNEELRKTLIDEYNAKQKKQSGD